MKNVSRCSAGECHKITNQLRLSISREEIAVLYQEDAEIIANRQVADFIFEIDLNVPKIANCAMPGQFVQIKITQSIDPLLRRPFSIFAADSAAGKISILYKVIGKGTKILSKKCSGERLNLLGPLGNGFDFSAQKCSGHLNILVGGGLGIAPLVFLAEKMKSLNNKILVLYGVTTAQEIVCIDELKKIDCELKIATDDGSTGFNGYASDLLADFLCANENNDFKNPYIYACGPFALLKQVHRLSEQYCFHGQVCLEKMMGCGLGVCLGCMVKIKNSGAQTGFSYQRVCKDGPVFDLHLVDWKNEKVS
ncbi:MAG: hypothetical protein DRP78_05380 [Candidatus Omnitrophota bacterium]|nr:MAG: hypothetical protein DRP78_05380 [Candidatus Omnitrophota bacterium]